MQDRSAVRAQCHQQRRSLGDPLKSPNRINHERFGSIGHEKFVRATGISIHTNTARSAVVDRHPGKEPFKSRGSLRDSHLADYTCHSETKEARPKELRDSNRLRIRMQVLIQVQLAVVASQGALHRRCKPRATVVITWRQLTVT